MSLRSFPLLFELKRVTHTALSPQSPVPPKDHIRLLTENLDFSIEKEH